MRANYYGQEKLDAELDKIEASLKAKGFKRVVFEVMSKLGREIYRERGGRVNAPHRTG